LRPQFGRKALAKGEDRAASCFSAVLSGAAPVFSELHALMFKFAPPFAAAAGSARVRRTAAFAAAGN
jgi:hypothetical protein